MGTSIRAAHLYTSPAAQTTMHALASTESDPTPRADSHGPIFSAGLLITVSKCTAHAAAVSRGSWAPPPAHRLQHLNPTPLTTAAINTRAFTAECGRIAGDPLSKAVTSCRQWQQQIGCALLEAQGYIPGPVQAFTPAQLTGNFTVPQGACGTSSLSSVLTGQQLLVDAGSRRIRAVIARGVTSEVYFLGLGAAKVCDC